MTLAEHDPRPDPVYLDQNAARDAILSTPQVRAFEDMLGPEVQRYLRYFQFGHLPPHLAMVSRPFCDMAYDLAARYKGPQLIVTLRSLLRAKDDAVRCALDERAEQVRYRPLRSGDPLHTANEAQAFIEGHDSTRGE